MTDNEPDTGGVPEPGGLAVVVVPADKVEAVLEFVQNLEREEADVSGYALQFGPPVTFSFGKPTFTLTGTYVTGGGADSSFSDIG